MDSSKFILEFHDQFHGVERIGIEVVDKVRFTGDFALIDSPFAR